MKRVIPMSSTTELRVVENATCTFCGCVCDDMELTVEDNHITKAKNACVLGKAWFLNHHVEERPVATIEGKPATLEEGIERGPDPCQCLLPHRLWPVGHHLRSPPGRRRHRRP